MSKKTRKIINIILIAILVVGLSFYGRSAVEKYRAKNIYNDVKSMVTGNNDKTAGSADNSDSASSPENEVDSDFVFTDPYVEELMSMDLSGLMEMSSAVKGWIYIPNSVIDYPILQHTDNEYYLRHTWDGEYNRVGSIFFDCQNEADLSDFNTIVYGHNMNNDAMFSTLEKYLTKNYIEDHPSIYIVNENGIYKYNIFAAHRTSVSTISFGMKIQTEPMRQEYISFALDYSEIDTDIIPTTEDSFLTLATCSYTSEYRIVIQAILDKDASYIRD